MIPRSVSLRLLCTLLLLTTVVIPMATAQYDREQSTATASASIFAGDVFEILGMSADGQGQFDWILTTDGMFVEAGRERIFRTRLTQPGTYTLDAQTTDEAGNRRLQMTIDVQSRPDGSESPDSVQGLDIVTTDPPAGNAGVFVDPANAVLTLTASPIVSGQITLDLNTGMDSGGDGDPFNDNDAADTLFSSEHNPLRIWYAVPAAAASLRLSTQAEDGTGITQDVLVTAGQPPFQSDDINISDEENGQISLSFPLDSSVDLSTVVYQWDFGDGRQSIVDAPIHRYLLNGEYSVRVTVREMATGRVVAQGTGMVTITGVPEVVTASSSASSVSSQPSGQTSSGGGSFLWTLLKILLVLIAAGALGAGGVWAARKFLHREGSLQKALEDAEAKLLNKEPASPDTAPATLQLKRPAQPEEPAVEVTETPTVVQEPPAEVAPPAAAPPPVIEPAPAPAWLEKGLTAAQSTPPASAPAPAAVDAPPAPPAPAPVVNELPPVAPVEPPATPVTPEPPQMTEEDMLPPWLKEEGTEATKGTDGTEVSGASTSVATPPPPAPVAMPTEAKTEPPAPAPASEPTPPLLETPITPVSLPTPAPAPALATPSAQTQLSAPTADQERAERERERKRRKRQRYRENLKKRSAETGSTTSAEAEQKQNIAPEPRVAPVQKMEPTKSVPQDIPPAQPSTTAASPAPADDKIAFMIKAEGVEKKTKQNEEDQRKAD